MSPERERLGLHVEVPVDEARLSRSWSAISARLAQPERTSSPLRPRLVAASVVLAAAALLFLVVDRGAGSGALATTDGASLEGVLAPGLAAPDEVHLDDGSRIAIDDGTVLETLESSSTRVAFALRSGRARFEITPGGPRRWSVEAGLVSVEVVGTVFTVDRTDEGVEVVVERGRVLVRGEGVPDGVRTLSAGESLRAVPVHVAPVTTTAEPVAATVEAATSEPAAATPVVATGPGAGIEASSPRPVAPTLVPDEPEPDAEVLLAAADAARREGRVEEALALLALAAGLDDDPSAPLAALTRGRMLLDRDRPTEAARDLRAALAGGLSGGLAETARARLVEALVAAGDHEGAAREAASYLRHHPDGAARDRVRELVP